MDMLVNLYSLPESKPIEGIHISRVLPPDNFRVLEWVKEQFGQGWQSESLSALAAQPSTCFIAQKNGKIVGFACYDATALGFFGPIGVREDCRGRGLGAALLLSCLRAMREAGYGYAVIGWCDEHEAFYRETAGAVPIPDSAPKRSVYGRLISPPEED